MSYQDSENKRTIRRAWNAALIEARFDEVGRPISYFGLPGPEIHDLLDWRPWLGQRTAVEWMGRTPDQRKEALETIGRLLMNVDVHEISSKFQLLRGEVEGVLLDGTDDDGTIPILADQQPAHRQRMAYDLFNLDFLGGVGYRNQHGPARRVAAIRRLFERQRGHDFILLLTVNVRHGLGEEIEHFLEGLSKRLSAKTSRESLQWYLAHSRGFSAQKLKATIPSFVRASAEPHQFKCRAFPPVLYEGHQRARMVHFMFDLRACVGNLGAFSSQGDAELIDLPLIECVAGQLRLANEQHPGFSRKRCAASLDFLPSAVRDTILDTVPQPAKLQAAKK